MPKVKLPKPRPVLPSQFIKGSKPTREALENYRRLREQAQSENEDDEPGG